MITTCGVLITDGNNFLICHPTGSKWWDLPKGQQDPGESHAETAVRELQEETGIRASQGDLVHLGVFDYRPKKQLSLFRMQVGAMPDPHGLHCTSKFLRNMIYVAEMDAFRIVDRQTCLDKVNPSMRKVLEGII